MPAPPDGVGNVSDCSSPLFLYTVVPTAVSSTRELGRRRRSAASILLVVKEVPSAVRELRAFAAETDLRSPVAVSSTNGKTIPAEVEEPR